MTFLLNIWGAQERLRVSGGGLLCVQIRDPGQRAWTHIWAFSKLFQQRIKFLPLRDGGDFWRINC